MIHLNFRTVNKKCKEGVVRAMKKCLNCGKIMSDDARFCISCGNELKDDNVLLEQIEGDTIEKTQVNTKLYKENITKKSDGNKRIYKVIAVILIIAVVFLVGQKIIGVEGTYYREGTLNDNLILRGGVAYSDGMVLCSYEKSGNKIIFYTDDGLYYGTYDWNEGKLYVDGDVYVKQGIWDDNDTAKNNQDIYEEFGIYINNEASVMDDGAYLLSSDSVENILEYIKYKAEQSGYNIMIVTVDDESGKEASDYAQEYYDNFMKMYQKEYSLANDGYVFVINCNGERYGMASYGKATNYYTNDKIDEILKGLRSEIREKEYEEAIIQFIDNAPY